MHQFIRIVGVTAVTVGIAYAVKQMKARKGSSRGWHKIKVEEKEQRKTGTRYGSNPVRY